MDSFIFNTATPSSSDVDLLIEKFRLEISNAMSTDDDDGETRRLTITPAVERHDSEPSNDIDKQISELETLIKVLQEEINELSHNTDRGVEEYVPIIVQDEYDIHEDLSNNTIILDNEPRVNSKNYDDESLEGKLKREDTRTDLFETEPFSHVFPLMIREVIIPLTGGLDTTHETDENVKRNNDTKYDEIITIKQDVVDVWHDLPEYAPKDNLEGLISELQAEISEKMDTLKDVIIEETDKNPDAKFEDA